MNKNRSINKPDFLGIGAQKAGTSWLFEWLEKHPEIFIPQEKEIHFWDKKYNYNKGYNWYEGLFSSANCLQKKGEITPAYAILEKNKIKEIKEYAPDLRIFYSMRNPMDRAWSHAIMLASREKLDIESLPDQWFINQFNSKNSLLRGDYEHCLKNWFFYFNSNQILMFLFDDIENRSREVLASVSSHIGVSKCYYKDVSISNISTPIFKNEQKYLLKNSLKSILLDLYFTKISRLSEFIGVDFSHWIKKYE